MFTTGPLISQPDCPAHGGSHDGIRSSCPGAVLIMLLSITPGWGQPVCVAPGCNPTTTDANGNTAGGVLALHLVEAGGGVGNTAFGLQALWHNTTGI